LFVVFVVVVFVFAALLLFRVVCRAIVVISSGIPENGR